VAFKKDRATRKKVNARIKGRKGGQGAKYEMAIMHHTVWVTRGLPGEFAVCLLLKPSTQGVAAVAVCDRSQGCNN
jgi:hypothetical protein